MNRWVGCPSPLTLSPFACRAVASSRRRVPHGAREKYRGITFFTKRMSPSPHAEPATKKTYFLNPLCVFVPLWFKLPRRLLWFNGGGLLAGEYSVQPSGCCIL